MAAIEPNVNFSARGADIRQMGILTVVDDKVIIPGFVWTGVHTNSIKNSVYVRITEPQLLKYAGVFQITLNVHYYIDKELTEDVDNNIPVTLVVSYNPNSGATYQAIDTYDLSQMSGIAAYKMNITVTGITSTNMPDDTEIPNCFQVGGTILIDRTYDIDPGIKLNMTASKLAGSSTTTNPATEKLHLTWKFVPGEEEYDIEWTTIDANGVNSTTANKMAVITDQNAPPSGVALPLDADLDALFRNNATRITTAEHCYDISLVYNSNYLVLRIRHVHYTTDGIRIRGNWDYSFAPDAGGAIKYAIVGLDWNEPSLNWQYSAAFAEEGKKKEVISYFDGTLRNRQTVTINNTDNVAVAQETIYDDFGRPAASVLPAPYRETSGLPVNLHFIKNFNLSQSSLNPYSIRDMFASASLQECETIPNGMSNTSGASKYYSASNELISSSFTPHIKNYNYYIPDAGLYPFSVTQYTNDNTGRIKLQGGVGPEFQPQASGSGKSNTTKYFYGKPEQWELDQMFGNDVGYADHYLKNMVIDPNGQASISYINASGKTIATALSGDAPTSLTALPSNVASTAHTINTILLKPDAFKFNPSELTVKATTTYLLSQPAQATSVSFIYNVSQISDLFPVTGSTQETTTCNYKLEVTVTDNCGKVVYHNKDGVPFSPDGVNHIIIPTEDLTQVGEYFITFELSLDKNNINASADAYIKKATTDGLLQNKYFYVKQNFLSSIDVSGNYNDCRTCDMLLGTADDFKAMVAKKFLEAGIDVASNDPISLNSPFSISQDFTGWIGDANTAGLYKTLSDKCHNLVCNFDPCGKYLAQMLQDVSPGGQYALYYSDLITPIEPEVNVLYNYFDIVFPKTGTSSTTDDDYVTKSDGSIISVYSSGFTPTIMLQYWKPVWANRFLQYHPEYCKLRFCNDMAFYENWDEKVEDVYTTANRIVSIDPAAAYDQANGDWLLAFDPFFTGNGKGVGFKSAMQADLNAYTSNVLKFTTATFNVLGLTQYIDYSIYRSGQETGTTNNPSDNTLWNAPEIGANDPCRVKDKEWAEYKTYYFQLKEKYYEQYRSASPLYCQTLACDVGAPVPTPLPGSPPDASNFTVVGNGTSATANMQSAKVVYAGAKFDGTVTLQLYYPSSIDPVKYNRVTQAIYNALTRPIKVLYTDFPYVFDIPADLPPSVVHVSSVSATNNSIASSFPTVVALKDEQVYRDASGSPTTNRTTITYINRFGEEAAAPNNVYVLVNYNVFSYDSSNNTTTPNNTTFQIMIKAGEKSGYVEYTSNDVDGHLGYQINVLCFSDFSGVDNVTSSSGIFKCVGPLLVIPPIPVVTTITPCFVYQNKQTRFPVVDYISSSITSSQSTQLQTNNNTGLLTQVTDACTSNAVSWIKSLQPGLDSHAISAYSQNALQQSLIDVCKAGGDSTHPFGVSDVIGDTMPNNNSLGSFAAAIKAILPSYLGGLFNFDLNPWLIASPGPYQSALQAGSSGGAVQVQPGSPVSINVSTAAISTALVNLYNTYVAQLASPATPSEFGFYTYLVSTYGPAMNMNLDDLTTLHQASSTCNYILNHDVILPPFLNPSAQVTWSQYQALKNALFNQFSEGAGLAQTVNYQVILTNYMNQNLGFFYNYKNYADYETVNNNASNHTILYNIPSYGNATPDPYAPVEAIFESVLGNASRAFDAYQNDARNAFLVHYIATLASVQTTVSWQIKTQNYHYTLYYYDQADNLVRTVPPEGVNLLAEADIATVQAARDDISGSITPLYPAHRLPTTYAYNSTNQVYSKSTPDADVSNFWYDMLSRLVASQNAKQAVDATTYSYTNYDPLGRITEVGQKKSANTLLTGSPYLADADATAFRSSGTNEQITSTYYDDRAILLPGVPAGLADIAEQDNLRKRVSASAYREHATDPVQQVTYYNYDLDGNVKTLWQQINGLTDYSNISTLKRIDYEYDLVSGKVNFVRYQDNKLDKFYYQYKYDAENRLVDAWTGTQALVDPFNGSRLLNENKRRDAHYIYYLHGPLARVELGDECGLVQGIDHAYTLQGWLMGVNGNSLGNVNSDMGQDGFNGSVMPVDAYAYTLGYSGFQKLIGSSVDGTGTNKAPAFRLNFQPQTAADITGRKLYNGNISYATLAIGVLNGGAPIGYSYGYDQLNRLLSMRQHNTILGDSWSSINTLSSFGRSSVINDYSEDFTYDANGNIVTLNRNGNRATGLPMDRLTYGYNVDGNLKITKNRLRHVKDAIATSNYADDLTSQNDDNYAYDPIGNLTSDAQAGLKTVAWTVYGKMQSIDKGGVGDLLYTYNAAGQRVSKTVENATYNYNSSGQPVSKTVTNGTTTYYVRDAQGNTMALYDTPLNGGDVTWREQDLYGSSRLGMWQPALNITTGTVKADDKWKSLGFKRYELSNHLGNVMATISDRVVPHFSSNTNAPSDYNNADVISAQDYYAFGSLMPGRSFDVLNPDAGTTTTGGGTTTTPAGGSTITNPPVVAGSLSLDGVGDNNLPSNHSTAVANNFTMELWVKPAGTIMLNQQAQYGVEGLVGQQYAISPTFEGGQATSAAAGIGLSVGINGISVYELSDGHLVPILSWDAGATGNSVLNNWTHVAVVYENKLPRLYINGIQVQTGEATIMDNVYPSYNIGNTNSYGAYNGLLSEFRIWNAVRSDNDIKNDLQNEVATTGTSVPEAAWKLDGTSDGTTITLADITGHGHDITLPKTDDRDFSPSVPIFNYNTINGTPDNTLKKSVNFTGTQNNPNTSATVTAVSNTFTVELWVKPRGTIALQTEANSGTDGVSGQQYAIFPSWEGGTGNPNNSGMGISVGTNGVAVYEHSDGYIAPLLVWTGSVSGWTHVAVVYDNKLPKLYINGTLVRTGVQSVKTNVYPSYNIGIGNQTGYGAYNGELNELHIWDYARTPTNIHDEVNPTNGDLLGDWIFNTLPTINDQSGKSNAITFTSGASLLTDAPVINGCTPGTSGCAVGSGGGSGTGSGSVAGVSGSSAYTYGFNGKENDNDVKGVGNQQDYGMRIYDPRVGRFLSLDPLTGKYPMLTAYQFASNSPIKFIDIDGKEAGEAEGETEGMREELEHEKEWDELHRSLKTPTNEEREKQAEESMKFWRRNISRIREVLREINDNLVENTADALGNQTTDFRAQMRRYSMKNGGGSFVVRNFKDVDLMAQKAWFKYQGQINGISGDIEYAKNGIRFDGFNGNALLEAKGNYQWLFTTGRVQKSDIYAKMEQQLSSQVDAARSNKLEWHFAEQTTLNEFKSYLSATTQGQQLLKKTELIYTKPAN